MLSSVSISWLSPAACGAPEAVAIPVHVGATVGEPVQVGAVENLVAVCRCFRSLSRH